ncbi:MAG: CDP-glucose 4,6-dehydratase [Nitrospirae bacterium]|nr:MAG: CDP-glucose 4,6-dehydratase [Nitrospirota bacterium]
MINKKLFGGVFKGKRVLVTGNTGFKGSWLSLWLTQLGADVAGFSIGVPTDPSNFEALALKERIKHYQGDVRDIGRLKDVFKEFSPEIVFHLAAQAITRKSYDEPQETFMTNLGGTVNVLECIRTTRSIKAAVIITSDKCYQNVEWLWGYRENDRLGGDDPYSASKGCAELAFSSYVKSFFSGEASPCLTSARAGNVIGGGDWAQDRIVPDCVRAFSEKRTLEIRSPEATRPWQHVLEPLSGYLSLCAALLGDGRPYAGEPFNFGPSADTNKSVKELISVFSDIWGGGKWEIKSSDSFKKESTLLKLNCDKAAQLLKWRPVLSFEETMKMTAEWYKAYYSGEKDIFGFTAGQINEYIALAEQRGLVWAG